MIFDVSLNVKNCLPLYFCISICYIDKYAEWIYCSQKMS